MDNGDIVMLLMQVSWNGDGFHLELRPSDLVFDPRVPILVSSSIYSGIARRNILSLLNFRRILNIRTRILSNTVHPQSVEKSLLKKIPHSSLKMGFLDLVTDAGLSCKSCPRLLPPQI